MRLTGVRLVEILEQGRGGEPTYQTELTATYVQWTLLAWLFSIAATFSLGIAIAPALIIRGRAISATVWSVATVAYETNQRENH